MSNFPVLEIFKSIQGEGRYTGVPSIFVRVTGCNLKCVFKNSICDTYYTSFKPEKPKWDVSEAIEEFKRLSAEYPNIKHIVITGGEPLLYKPGLVEFLLGVESRKYNVTIETNGSLPPLANDNLVDLYSISPKLSTSVDKDLKFLTKRQADLHNKTRINLDNLKQFLREPADFQLKFVYSGPESVEEILDLRDKLSNFSKQNIDDAIMLMPEGQTQAQLTKSRIEAIDNCIKYGWTYTERVHIVVWGDKKEV